MYFDPEIIYLEITPEDAEKVIKSFFDNYDPERATFTINKNLIENLNSLGHFYLRVFGGRLKHIDLFVEEYYVNENGTITVACALPAYSWIQLQEDGFYHSNTSRELEKRLPKKSKYSITDIRSAFTNFRNLRNDLMGPTPFFQAFRMAWERWRFARKYSIKG